MSDRVIIDGALSPSMKADRLLSALLLLQAHGRMTGREMSQRLEVSLRTVHRDMEALSMAGVPVFALRGARGGWQLDEGWRTQVPALDEAELLGLLMAQPRVVGDGFLAGAAERALRKLTAALPAALRERAASIRQRLYVDTAGWRGTAENLAMLPIVQDAVSRDRKLSMMYRRAGADAAAERVVDPLGLVAKGSAWYLVAKSPEGFRTYRVSRIEEAAALDVPCERPPNFDLAAHWKSSTDEFRENRPRFSATLYLDEQATAWVRRWRLTWSEQGSTFHARFENEDEALFVILGLGAHVEVIEPIALRERVLAEAEAIILRAAAAERHDRSASASPPETSPAPPGTSAPTARTSAAVNTAPAPLEIRRRGSSPGPKGRGPASR
jgi:predicted DNA-binding transcriptional regulator YafY